MRSRSRGLPQVSPKRAARRAARERVVDQAFRRDRWACQARELVPDVECDGPIDPHERIPRSAWPDGDLVVENVVTVCRAHHRWIDNNPAAAHARGLHGYSWERPGADDA